MEQLNMLTMEIGAFLNTEKYHLFPFGLKDAALDSS